MQHLKKKLQKFFFEAICELWIYWNNYSFISMYLYLSLYMRNSQFPCWFKRKKRRERSYTIICGFSVNKNNDNEPLPTEMWMRNFLITSLIYHFYLTINLFYVFSTYVFTSTILFYLHSLLYSICIRHKYSSIHLRRFSTKRKF